MTYSIVARDESAGELGIAVQSRYFGAGRIVPWIESGVGVIASQAFSNPVYGYEGLRLLREGTTPESVLEKLLGDDPGAATRQVAILDSNGLIAAHTGSGCVAAAGHAIGASCCAQANMMKRDTVWGSMVHTFENTEGDLSNRLLKALEAAENEGGDLRGRQAAALIVVKGALSSQRESDRVVDVRVDDHPDPVSEIRRLLSYARAHARAERGVQKILANDPSGALADLDACCLDYPNEPEFLFRRAVIMLALGRVEEAREVLRQVQDINSGWIELLLRFADSGVIPVSRGMLEPLVASLRTEIRST